VELIYPGVLTFLQEGDTIFRSPGTFAEAVPAHPQPCRISGFFRMLLLISVMTMLVTITVLAETNDGSLQVQDTTQPEIIHTGIFVSDFRNFNVEQGSFSTTFFLILSSDTPVTIDDIQLMYGRMTSVETIVDTPGLKNYQISAEMTTTPDLRRYPFDRHTLPIQIKHKHKNDKQAVFVIDTARTGLDKEAVLPGWEFCGSSAYVTNKTFLNASESYSRAVFTHNVQRDTLSTLLKFFLPILIIVIISLCSLLMKTSSRLGVNASMFLAAVMIHWRIADAIPLVGYATFLDEFMIITYATLGMVVVTGIVTLMLAEAKDTAQIEMVNRWSLRIIPPLSIGLYCLLFLTLLV